MRLIFRTHYQAVGVIVYDALLRVVSPVESASRAALGDALSRAVAFKMNPAAGGYAVDAGQGLGLLTDRITLHSRAAGYALAAPLDSSSPGRSWFYFRALIARDGAMVLELLHLIAARGAIAVPDVFSDAAIDAVFLTIFEHYFRKADDLYERDYLRTAMDRLRRDGFQPKTRKHKLMFHLVFMRDLGLIKEIEANGDRRFVCTNLGARCIKDVHNLDSLDALCTSEDALDNWAAAYQALPPKNVTLAKLLDAYRDTEGLGIKLIPVETLQSVYAFLNDVLVERGEIVAMLLSLRERYPDAVYLYGYGANPHDGVRIDLSRLIDDDPRLDLTRI